MNRNKVSKNLLLARKKSRRGFTLVELVVVIAIIAVLAAVSVASYFGITDRADKSNTDVLTAEVQKLYKTYVISNNTVGDSPKDVIDQADGFIDYCEENGLDRTVLNYSYISSITDEESSQNRKRANGSEFSTGGVAFLIKGSGSYFSSFVTKSYSYSLSNTFIVQPTTVKGLQKVTDTVLSDYCPVIDGKVDVEATWEFPIDSSGISDTKAEQVAIIAQKEGSETQVLYTRYGKKITYSMTEDLQVGNTTIYVSSVPFKGAVYNKEDNLYYLSADCGWVAKDGVTTLNDMVNAFIDQGDNNIVNNELVLDYKPLSIAAPFEGVATKTRMVKGTIRHYDASAVKDSTLYNPVKYTDEIISSPEDQVNYIFADGTSALASAKSYTAETTYRVNKLSISSGCNGDEIAKQNEADETVSTRTASINDEIFISKSTTVARDISLPEGIDVIVLNEGRTSADPYYSYSDTRGSSALLSYDQHGSVLLTIESGVTLVTNGSLYVTAVIKNASGGQTNSGVLLNYNEFAEINLAPNSKIVINSASSILGVYGRITGEGMIDANKGTVIDKFCLYDWKGGSNLYGCYVSETGGFPFYEYNLSDIQAELSIAKDVTYTLQFSVYGGGGDREAPIDLIGEKGLFSIDSGRITKTVDKTNFKTTLEVEGVVHTNLVNISVNIGFSVSFTGEGYAFPLYNMDIVIGANAIANVKEQAFELMPGSSIINKGQVNLSSSLLIYETFTYFETSNFKAMYSFDGVPGAQFINQGLLTVMSGASIAGKVTNSGTIALDETDTTIKKEITPVIIIGNTGSSTSSIPVYATTTAPIIFEIVAA